MRKFDAVETLKFDNLKVLQKTFCTNNDFEMNLKKSFMKVLMQD